MDVLQRLYPITKEINKLVGKINDKYETGIIVELYSDEYISPTDFICNCRYQDYWDEKAVPVIDETVIRNILTELQDVLGNNEEYTNYCFAVNNIFREGEYDRHAMCMTHIANKYIPKSKAVVLCEKWLDGLNPKFNCDSIAVLEELKQVLTELV